MTYEMLEKVNKEMKTIDVKGKPYPEVTEKIKAFKKIYPDGSIQTELISDIDGKCLFKAVVSVTDIGGQTITLGTGHAFEVQNQGYINKTSYIENCETSAVGRALSMAGFGSDNSVRGFEEVVNATVQQDELALEEKKKESIGAKAADVLAKTLTENQLKWALKKYKVKKLEDITNDQYRDLNERLIEIQKMNGNPEFK